MKKNIIINGVKTNNLKNLNINIETNKITAITGISGGGKSSLAYDTIHELCKREFLSIESGYYDNPLYEVEMYKNIIPSVSLKQKNSNINPRSTLYTYLNIPSLISGLLTSNELRNRKSIFKINKPQNQCPFCHGTRSEHSAHVEQIIINEKTIEENPFKPWISRENNKKHNLLLAYCNKKHIPIDIPFYKLSENQRYSLLNEDSLETYPISYIHLGKRRNRNLKFVGLLNEIKLGLSSDKKSIFESSVKYAKESNCSHCMGSGLNVELYKGVNLYGIPFLEFMTDNINSIYNRIKQNNIDSQPITRLLEQISRSGLSYLSLNRSIPSLSGGELQKLNFSKLCNSEITGILVVIDEISSQVHVSDYQMLYERIRSISTKGNTVILVEHNDYFVSRSDNIIILGPNAGETGGYIVENPPAYDIKKYSKTPSKFNKNDFFEIKKININNVKDLDLRIPLNSISILVGKSGSGKSSIAKYIDNNYNDVTYISQSLIKGNIMSTVSSLTGINKKISQFFSKHFNLDSNFFTLNKNSPIICQDCLGKGVIKINRSFEKDIEISCPTCDGLLFSDKCNEYSINGISIRDIYNFTFTELYKLDLPQISTVCENAISLGLGHLSLNRKTKTLSGGELKRIKILINLPIKNTKNKILIIDEPASGLDNNTASNVIGFIKRFSKEYKSIIIIDHKPIVFLSSDYVIEIGPGSGIDGGKIVYEGNPIHYYNNVYLRYLK